MKKNSYLRLALLFNENGASTFDSNLRKMISLVLYENYDKHGLSSLEIKQELDNKYLLKFTEGEIENAIVNSKEKYGIVTINNSENKYSLSPETKAKLKERVEKPIVNTLIKRFISKTKTNVDEEFLINLILTFLYNVFNSNKEIMLSMIGKGDSSVIETLSDDFTDDQKILINKFISWEDNEKNKYIYELISCCFDYCSLTMGDNRGSLKQMFTNKRFFLDTNILFRMMGLNDKNRKYVIESFIKKCKEMNINLCYTNYTKDELFKTIDYHVDEIKEKLKGSQPLSLSAISIMTDDINPDIYEEYLNWSDKNTDKYNEYDSFKNYLKLEATKIINSFEFCSYKDYEAGNSEKYQECFNSLRSYKYSKNRKTNDYLLKVDVNNFLYVEELNSKVQKQDCINIPNFIISTDHIYSEWDRKIRPSAVPIVVLPSVWYSIMLHYTSRAEDDYYAFSRFINFSYYDKGITNKSKRENILKLVLNLNESSEIKNKIIFDIDRKLQTEYIENNNDEEIVNSSKTYVTQNMLKELENRKNNEIQVKLDNQKKDLDKIYGEQLNKKSEENNDAIENIVTKIAITNRKKHFIVCLLFASIFVVSVTALCIYFLKTDAITENEKFVFEIVKLVFPILQALIYVLIFVFKFKCLDLEKIKDEVRIMFVNNANNKR